MSPISIATPNLDLVGQTRTESRAQIDGMSPQDRATVSAAWLAQLDASTEVDPWIHGFRIVHRATGAFIGNCGFKGPPDGEGMVEIAYGLAPEHQGKGYATEAAQGLTQYAFAQPTVRIVRAHTLPERNASARVLTKCGFRLLGDVIDPEDGRVWRWERP
jgi:RimJ/RimL family protein N-acetyltransferase